MESQSSFCRIGVFYDGSYFLKAQRYFYHEKKLGWLTFQPLHAFIEHFVSTKEQRFSIYKVVYAAWHQGLFSAKDATEDQLRKERHQYLNLLHAGIEAKFLPMSQSQKEKGVDVALAVDALQIGLDSKIDIAVLFTGDGDFVPLVRVLNKHGIRVVGAYFDFKDKSENETYINERLLNCCNYRVDVSALGESPQFKSEFKSLFRTAGDWETENQGVVGRIVITNKPAKSRLMVSSPSVKAW